MANTCLSLLHVSDEVFVKRHQIFNLFASDKLKIYNI